MYSHIHLMVLPRPHKWTFFDFWCILIWKVSNHPFQVWNMRNMTLGSEKTPIYTHKSPKQGSITTPKEYHVVGVYIAALTQWNLINTGHHEHKPVKASTIEDNIKYAFGCLHNAGYTRGECPTIIHRPKSHMTGTWSWFPKYQTVVFHYS